MVGARGLEPSFAHLGEWSTEGQAPDLLGVIRIGNRWNFAANAVPADLLRVPMPRRLFKLIKFVKYDKCGASRAPPVAMREYPRDPEKARNRPGRGGPGLRPRRWHDSCS